tara:strand:+ start:8620 stop:9273 length:654 start_codon:yes stop_codon:yes gene_type:complete
MISTQFDRVKQDRAFEESDEALRPMDAVIEAALAENHQAFLGFLVRRLGNRSAAEDVLQNFSLRAIRKGAKLRDSESATAWLYSVLRSVLIDHYRSEATRQRRETEYAQEQTLLGNDSDDVELEESVCSCIHGLISKLRPDYAEVLRRVDLAGDPRNKVAADLGITPTNLRVRLHRAHQALQKALGRYCGSCCEHGFRDCDGQSTHGGAANPGPASL